jgi:hypothetical protein
MYARCRKVQIKKISFPKLKKQINKRSLVPFKNVSYLDVPPVNFKKYTSPGLSRKVTKKGNPISFPKLKI